MAFIRKIKGSLVRQDSSIYVGEDTYLFYDIDTGCIRRSDGVTPGGVPLDIGCFGGAGGPGAAAIEIQDDGVTLSTEPTLFNFTGAGVTLVETNPDEFEIQIPGSTGSAVPGLTTSVINGQPMLTLEDTTRANKVLSVGEQVYTWAENRLTNLDWVRMGNATDADSGYIADFDGTIVYASVHCENTNANSMDIHVYVDGDDEGSIGTLSGGTNAIINNNTLNIDFVQGQKIRVRAENGSGTVQDTVVKLTVKWRG